MQPDNVVHLASFACTVYEQTLLLIQHNWRLKIFELMSIVCVILTVINYIVNTYLMFMFIINVYVLFLTLFVY